MRVLLSSENFDSFAGTETYTLTVAQQLERLGHEVAVYAPNRGAIAQFARREGVRVLGIRELPRGCELLVFGDAATCHELAPRYGDAVRLFVAHSCDHALQTPPLLGDRCHGVVVLSDRVRRAVAARGWHAPIVRLRQPIDTARFRNVGPPRIQARRALVLTNYLAGARADLVERACRANGIAVSWAGATTSPSASPEQEIASADLVIGIGRSALEGMAAGRAAYVYGLVGGDGWVTPERYPAMEADGFAGLSAGDVVLDGDRLTEDLARWHNTMGELNRDLVFAHHEARQHAIELVSLAASLGCPPSPAPTAGDELAHLVRREREAYTRAIGALSEAGRLRSELAQREDQEEALRAELAGAQAKIASLQGELGELASARANIASLQRELDEMRSTRRYRLACRVAGPLDRLRQRRNDERS